MKNYILSLFCSTLFVSLAIAQIPRTMSYQGVLTDNQGNFLPDGNHTLTLKLYDDFTGDFVIYMETHTVPVVKGIFNVIIGSISPIPEDVNFDRPYFLGVSVDSELEMRPRTALTAAPYALRAERANVADTLAPGAVGVVTSLNQLQGDIFLSSGVGVSTSINGKRIEINVADPNPTNELQDLTYDTSTKILVLSKGGNSVDLSSLGRGNQPWTESGTNIFNSNLGNVGIGTKSPNEKLEVNGEVLITGGTETGFGNSSLRVLPANTGNISAIYAKGTGLLGNGIEAEGNIGITGITNSSTGAGVLGFSSGKSPGIIGRSNDNIGIKGIGNTGVSGEGIQVGISGIGNIGLYGKSTGVGGNSRCILGEGGAITIEAIQNSPGIGVALQGISVNGLGYGVVGISNGTGNGVYGVNSTSSGPSGYAGLFEGRVKITNTLTMFDEILPNATNAINLGSSVLRWKKIFVEQIEFGSNNILQDGGVNIASINKTFRPETNNTLDLGTSTARWRDVWCARSAFNGSDKRMKRNIKTLDYGLAELLKLNVYSYYWIDSNLDDGIRNLGVIAQELKEILPELVRESHEGEKLMSVNYTGLIPVLINAIKEQQKQIEDLKRDQVSLGSQFTVAEIKQIKAMLSQDSVQK